MKANNNKSITLKNLLINEVKQIGIQFQPDKVVQALLKELPNIKWSKEFSMAYIPNNKVNIKLIFQKFRGVAWVNGNYFFSKKRVFNQNEPINVEWFRRRKVAPGYKVCPEEYLLKLELKCYANNTVKTYIKCFERFINAHEETDYMRIDEREIRSYLQELIQKGYSDSYVNQMINSIKFYYELVKGMPNRFYSIERPRKKEALPKVISLEEVKGIILNSNNIKHKCIVSLLYSAGLRRSELLNLKLQDIDSKRMTILVKNSKGGKDRITMLNENVLKDLRKYYKEWKPQKYLFEGKEGTQYSASSVLNIIKKAAKKAGIKKNVSPHILRHSFATHLLENGTDLRYIQSLMGHSSSKTTEIYTQVATNHLKNIKSPIELLNLS